MRTHLSDVPGLTATSPRTPKMGSDFVYTHIHANHTCVIIVVSVYHTCAMYVDRCDGCVLYSCDLCVWMCTHDSHDTRTCSHDSACVPRL